MAKIKVWVDPKAVFELMRSQEVSSELKRRANSVAEAARGFGGQWDVSIHEGSHRANAMVSAGDMKALNINAKHNALLKSINAGSG